MDLLKTFVCKWAEGAHSDTLTPLSKEVRQVRGEGGQVRGQVMQVRGEGAQVRGEDAQVIHRAREGPTRDAGAWAVTGREEMKRLLRFQEHQKHKTLDSCWRWG